ncbi:hypothetical protein SALB1_2062 [Salinisphaera sp. LB1]|nr:hypothetical protein SALB1_2062 [Salinisphaera sp. LB1]
MVASPMPRALGIQTVGLRKRWFQQTRNPCDACVIARLSVNAVMPACF